MEASKLNAFQKEENNMRAMQMRIFKTKEEADWFAEQVDGVVVPMTRYDNETGELTNDVTYCVDYDFQ